LKYGIAGICVLDAETGKVIFEKNSNTGLAPASTQKVITSIAAFEALGPSFQFQTKIGYTGKISGRKLNGDLVVFGSGDPTLGSSRYTATTSDIVLSKIASALKLAGIDTVSGNIITTNKGFDLNPIPEGWIWGDMGNYYGAGVWGLNWNENQYDIFVKTGNTENSSTSVEASQPEGYASIIINDVKSGKPGTGDGSVIYADPFSSSPLIQGKLEPGKSRFKVSGATPNADEQALVTIKNYLQTQRIFIKGAAITPLTAFENERTLPNDFTALDTINSPGLDSISYWFLHKSINLYGEALLRYIALAKKGFGSNRNGLEWLDSFYAANKFDTEALHLYDGSGLSPANRITAYALSSVLYFAKGKPWFPYFYDALPEYNGMKLKSGTINRVKSFAGYHTSKGGKKYIVAFMVNNYNGPHSSLVNKMFTVLDCLK
jgi:D-alanyl-D-alanine carboxypeptidase/D-alanyl-D-alanine-endopeptidase (penicillin-binding protein 4)